MLPLDILGDLSYALDRWGCFEALIVGVSLLG